VAIQGRDLAVDGFNVIITLEAALSGGVLLRGRDGRVRDLASVHGSYRRVEETPEALDMLVAATAHAASAVWVLDRPVSNSGRLAAMLRDHGATVELHPMADTRLVALCREGRALASSDGPLMDRVLAAGAVKHSGPLVDLLATPLQTAGAAVLDLGK